jgi:hypothetical protein
MYVDVDLADSGWNPVVSFCAQSNELSSSIKGEECLEYPETISFSRMTPLLNV